MRFVFTCGMAVIVVGCASIQPNAPGTGDISFRLVWSGSSDLDLYVRSPLGEEISVRHRTSTSGGVLDRDCNATQETMCDEPLENVFWPRGAAPKGAYEYWARFVNLHSATFPVVFRLQVMRGSKTVVLREGVVGSFREAETRWQFQFEK